MCTILFVLLVADDNKEMASMFTDHPDMLDLLHIRKVTCINTLVGIFPWSEVFHQVDIC